MKYTLLYVLLLLALLASCSKRSAPSPTLRPDSLRVSDLLYRKARMASSLDSVRHYTNLSLRYLSNPEMRADVYLYIGRHCEELGELEAALEYYGKTHSVGPNAWVQNRLCEVMPDIYVRMGRFSDAVRCLDSIRHQRISRSIIPYYALSKGNLYAMVNQVDSACHYYTLAANSLNRWVAEVASHRLSLLYTAKGCDSLAYVMALKADKVLKDEMLKEESAEAHSSYEREKMQNELNRLKIGKQQREILALSLGISFILIIFLFYFFLQRRKRQANELLLREKTISLEQAHQLLEQAEELTFLREKESQLRESLFRRMKSFHKIPSLEETNDEETDANNQRIALSQEDWDDIRKTVDKSYDNFTDRLLQAFPSLSEKDINFCCLVKIGVSIKDLSDIYCISRTSISRKKQRMKRDKLGLTAEDETLDAFLRCF